MSIDQPVGKPAIAPPPPPDWGEVAPEGQVAHVTRFVFTDRVVAFPGSELKRWEHTDGEPELLIIQVGKEEVIVEGRELAPIRIALDLRRLCELRTTVVRAAQPGPKVMRMEIVSD